MLVFVIFAQSEPFFKTVSKEPRWYVILSIAVVQPHLYLQYFLSQLNPSRLDNRACKPYTTAIKCLFSTSDPTQNLDFNYLGWKNTTKEKEK